LRHILGRSLVGLTLAALTMSPVWSATDSRVVTTETIAVSPEQAAEPPITEPPTDQAAPTDDAAPADEAAPADDAPADAAPSDDPDATLPTAPKIPMEVPVVEYDLTKLPKPVARLREQIIEAATSGDPEKLRPIIDANGEPPVFGPSDTGDPIGYLKLQSGDDGGREILAILIEVLDAGYVHVDVGTPDEMYVWPYFARYPLDKLTPPQLVELFKLVFAGDYQDMLADGVYSYFSAGISPDGTWRYFQSGD
jgi:hypothetical protein